MERRLFVGMVLVSFVGPSARAQSDPNVAISWRIPADGVQTAKRYIGQPKSIVPDTQSKAETKGVPLLFIISAVAIIPDLATAIVRVYREYRYGGVIIRVKNGGFDITTDSRLPRTMVVVQNEAGVSVYEIKDPDSEALGKILASVLGSASKQAGGG